MERQFLVHRWLILGLLACPLLATASNTSPVRVLRSAVADCSNSTAESSEQTRVEACLRLDIAWVHNVPRGAKPFVDVVHTGASMIEEVSDRFRSHAPDVFDAIAIYLGRRIQRGGKRRALAQAALERLFLAGLILCHRLEENVSLTLAIERRVAKLGFSFFRETGKKLVVTSGSRSAEAQAKAMHTKQRLGVKLTRLYKGKSAREIERAFDEVRKKGGSRDQIIAAGARVIREQMARGDYISKHLMHDAVDIRSRNLSRKHKSLFRKLARQHGFRVLLETRPPHFHLSIAAPEA
ncbi:MAG: hypothetical protein VX223_02055 [Myxococcota bacterium]|nr:hypothetical protein [Myxococcota bacterium]